MDIFPPVQKHTIACRFFNHFADVISMLKAVIG
jgi:hypothetical protein